MSSRYPPLTEQDAERIADALEAGRSVHYEGHQGYFDVVEHEDGLFFAEVVHGEDLMCRTGRSTPGMKRDAFVRSLVGKSSRIYRGLLDG